MIKSLHIEHYVLIDHLDIDFEQGLSVITGETGAGKSIILGALSLLEGARADVRSIRQGEQRCTVEAEFQLSNPDAFTAFFEANDLDFDGHSCIVSRQLTASGKSRAFINDTPVTLNTLRSLTDRLIDIHSQHQNLLLGEGNFQLNILDTLAANADLRSHYTAAYHRMKQLEQQLADAIAAQQHQSDNADYLQFQYEQLCEADLREGEQEALEAEALMLEHANEIGTSLATARQAIDSDTPEAGADTLQRLSTALSALHSVESKYAPAAELAQRIDSTLIELKDIADEISQQADNIEVNPARLELVEQRLDTLYSLQKKHRVDSIEALITLRDTLAEQLRNFENIDYDIARLRKEVQTATQALTDLGQQLSQTRTAAAHEKVEQQVVDNLHHLGMPNARFTVRLTSNPQHPQPSGIDQVQILFSANKNQEPHDIGQTASGGEIARVMLCLKALLAQRETDQTIIFDEIDTGVSGAVAERMAQIMQQIGGHGRQVISITHLPQIAAYGQQHYRVYKTEADDTTTHIQLLGHEDRITELAHMLSGTTITAAALQNAQSLLTLGQ